MTTGYRPVCFPVDRVIELYIKTCAGGGVGLGGGLLVLGAALSVGRLPLALSPCTAQGGVVCGCSPGLVLLLRCGSPPR